MKKLISKSKIIFLMIILLIYIPFFESYHSSTLWGLNWKSPEMMDSISNYLRLLKLLCVAVGLSLLTKNSEQLKVMISAKAISMTFMILSYFLSFIQIIFLLIGMFFSLVSSLDLSYIHKEKVFDNYTIYAYTADSGAVGKAYHYFFIKCAKPFGRYELIKVKKTEWMGEFDFEVKDNELLVMSKSVDDIEEHKVNLTQFNQCDSLETND